MIRKHKITICESSIFRSISSGWPWQIPAHVTWRCYHPHDMGNVSEALWLGSFAPKWPWDLAAVPRAPHCLGGGKCFQKAQNKDINDLDLHPKNPNWSKETCEKPRFCWMPATSAGDHWLHPFRSLPLAPLQPTTWHPGAVKADLSTSICLMRRPIFSLMSNSV